MRISHSLLLVTLIFLAGCKTYNLDDEWKPLEQIVQSKVLSLGVSAKKGARVVGENVYVWSLDKFLDIGEPRLTAKLKHEQVHAIRQFAHKNGVPGWLMAYAVSTGFRWAEEQLGFYEQIIYLRSHGVGIVVDSWADKMSGITYGFMVDKDDAVEWLNKVLNGWWTPPE